MHRDHKSNVTAHTHRTALLYGTNTRALERGRAYNRARVIHRRRDLGRYPNGRTDGARLLNHLAEHPGVCPRNLIPHAAAMAHKCAESLCYPP